MDNVSEVKDKADIVDLIKGYVPLKKAGINYKGNCPFHKEKTPSFMVNPDLQIYKCFGCGKSGDVISFVMEIEGIEFYDALKLLADKYGVNLVQNDKIKKAYQKKTKLFEINEIATKFYSAVLLNHSAGKKALSYLKERKIKPTTIREFKIGYAPNSWRSISKLLLKKGYTENEIITVGLAKKRKMGGLYDIYRDRIVFPLVSPVGKVVGFAGRSLSKDVNPKYLNTSQTLLFHKDKFLFGLNLSKVAIRQEKTAIIAEGLFDMVSPYQAGIKNIVASQGTALTDGQLNVIERYADSVVLLFDNDMAGITASLRGISLVENSSLEIKVATIPSGFKDPDEVVLKDPKLLKEAIDKAMFIGDFYLFYVKENFDLSNVYQKSKAVKFLVDKLSKMTDEVIRNEYIKKYTVFLDVDESVLVKKIGNDKGVIKENAKTRNVEIVEDVKYPIGEIYLISLLIKCSKDMFLEKVKLIEDIYFSNKTLRKIFRIILDKKGNDDKDFDFKALYDKLRPVIDSENILNSFFLTEFEDKFSNKDFIETELLSSVERLRKEYLQRKLKFLSKEIKKAEMTSDFNKVSVLNEEFKKISKELS